MIKASDFIAQFLAGEGIRHAFAITGGASIHIIHSIGECNGVEYVCPHHEQAGAMAADAYARVTGGLGCAIATSGPGATNLITGIASSWFDSVPVLYLTGQVARFRFKGDTGVRQMGFQETDITAMVKPITKYAVTVMAVEDLRYELEKAVHIAKSGRPGPVLVDIPDDLQREMVDPNLMRSFMPEPEIVQTATVLDDRIKSCEMLLRQAKRPVLVLGWGVRLSGAEREVIELIERLGIPVCPSWGAVDMIPGAHPLLAGAFGTHGTRAGNFTIQNADLVIAIGARLSTRETGSPLTWWAREAKVIVVDIDEAELRKFSAFGKELEFAIQSDASAFICSLSTLVAASPVLDIGPWLKHIRDWRNQYPACKPAYRKEDTVNPYVFVDILSGALTPDDIVVIDTGCAVAWMMQAFEPKSGQRLLHAFNNTPMGYALPGAVGAAFAAEGKRIICIAGDGSLMMNLQEFSTLQHHRLPIKIFLLNNNGYSMVQQTQDQWLGSKYYASSNKGGLSFPDFSSVAKACGIEATEVHKNVDVKTAVEQALASQGPHLCNIFVPSTARVIPQSRYGYPIEDAEPLLPRDEFLRNMIVRPLPVSEKPL